MNNKVKFALAIGTFIILVVIGTFLMKKDEEVVFYSGEEEYFQRFVHMLLVKLIRQAYSKLKTERGFIK